MLPFGQFFKFLATFLKILATFFKLGELLQIWRVFNFNFDHIIIAKKNKKKVFFWDLLLLFKTVGDFFYAVGIEIVLAGVKNFYS